MAAAKTAKALARFKEVFASITEFEAGNGLGELIPVWFIILARGLAAAEARRVKLAGV